MFPKKTIRAKKKCAEFFRMAALRARSPLLQKVPFYAKSYFCFLDVAWVCPSALACIPTACSCGGRTEAKVKGETPQDSQMAARTALWTSTETGRGKLPRRRPLLSGKLGEPRRSVPVFQVLMCSPSSGNVEHELSCVHVAEAVERIPRAVLLPRPLAHPKDWRRDTPRGDHGVRRH